MRWGTVQDRLFHHLHGRKYLREQAIPRSPAFLIPEPLKGVGIYRGDRHQDSPIPQSAYVESLKEKYGLPASGRKTHSTLHQVIYIDIQHIGNGPVGINPSFTLAGLNLRDVRL